MNIDFKELGLTLVTVVIGLVLYHHVVAPMISSEKTVTASPAPSTTVAEG